MKVSIDDVLKNNIIKDDYTFIHEKQIINKKVINMFTGVIDTDDGMYNGIPLTIFITDNNSVFIQTYYVNEDEVELGERDIESMCHIWINQNTILKAILEDRLIIDDCEISELPFIDEKALNKYIEYKNEQDRLVGERFINENIKKYNINYQHGKLLNDLGLKLTYKKMRRQHIVHTSDFYKLSEFLFNDSLVIPFSDHPSNQILDLNGKHIDSTSPYIGWFENSDFNVNDTLYIFESVLNGFRKRKKQKTISIYLVPDSYHDTRDDADIVTLLFITEDHVIPKEMIKYKVKPNPLIEPVIEQKELHMSLIL